MASSARRVLVRLVLVAFVITSALFVWRTRSEAHNLVTNPRASRKTVTDTPAARGLKFDDVAVTTTDGMHLRGWFIPGAGPATVMIVHGYKDSRSIMLGVADILHKHGFHVVVASLRGHDDNDGDQITFGLRELADLDAFYRYAITRREVDRRLFGLFGASMGGTISIGYAAENPAIRALVSDCAFSSVRDTVETSVTFFTGLPPFPFAPAIVFWAEREIKGDVDDVDAKKWIRRVAPRPVLVMQGGSDRVVSPESGARLFEAAGEPKELWFEPSVGHAQFLHDMPDQFESRVTAFFKRNLRRPAP